jgi:hypothetical protein
MLRWNFLKALVVLIAVIFATEPVMCAAQGTTAPPTIVYVWDYLSPAERIDVANRTAGLDVTTSINNAISVVPSVGGKLVFAPGLYNSATCNFSISKNMYVEGGGPLVYSYSSFPTGGLTNIRCTATAAPVFNVTASYASFNNMGGTCTAASPTAGSTFILANGPSEASRVDYNNITVDGCYDAIDNAVGNSWVMTNSILMNWKRYGVRVRNTQNADAGDWAIKTTKMYPNASPATACIRIESSGGGDIDGVHCLPNGGTLTDGISMDTTGVVTQELSITNTKIDHVLNSPINITNGLTYTRVVNNFLRTDGVNKAAGVFGNSGFGLIADNILVSGGTSTGEAITFSTYNRTTLGFNQVNGFAFMSAGGTNYMNNQSLGVMVPAQSTQTVSSLPGASTVAPGVCAIVTDANSTTFHATVAGSGSNIVKVCSDGTNWKIGG